MNKQPNAETNITVKTSMNKENDVFDKNHAPSLDSDHDPPESDVRVYKRRWLMLAMYVLCSALNSYQWVQYSIINNIVIKYYAVSSVAVNATTLIFMATYVLFLIPACYIIDKKGLRYSIILAAVGTSLGSIVKCLSVYPAGFFVSFLGQTLVAMMDVILFIIPTRVASVWFGSDQVALAGSAGIFGFQLGSAASFMITPLVVRNHETLDDIGVDLQWMFVTMAMLTTGIAICIVAFFQEKPPKPASLSAALKESTPSEMNFTQHIYDLMSNRSYLLLVAVFAVAYGTLGMFGALLNEIVLSYVPHGEVLAGRLGAIFEGCGVIFSVAIGPVMDRSKKYKEITVMVLLMATIAYCCFTLSLIFNFHSHVWLYLSAAAFGCFLSGSLPVCYEVSAELTYPVPESYSAGILGFPAQIAVIVFTLLFGHVMKTCGTLPANCVIVTLLFLGALLSLLIKKDLRRQKAQRQNEQFKQETTELKSSGAV